MKYNNSLIIMVMIIAMALSSCVKDLNISPLNTKVSTPDVVYSDTSNYIKSLAKIYSGMTNYTTDGNNYDIVAGDAATTSFLRLLFGAEEYSTDEAINVWGDPNLFEYHYQSVTDINGSNTLLFQRLLFNIAECNEYIREVAPRVAGLTGTIKTEVTTYLAEARFMRALFYYYAMDEFANPPFITETDIVGGALPKQIKRADLFNYVTSQLKTCLPDLLPANQQAQYYGRANQAAAWTLLAKCYLNAGVFTGTPKYDSCHLYCDMVISKGGYSLISNYANLFLNDNNVTGLSEIIFPIVEDATSTPNNGGVTFIINASANGSDADIAYYGAGGWKGNVATGTFIYSWGDLSVTKDTRALFPYAVGGDLTPLSALKQANWKNSMQVGKFRNVSSTQVAAGTPGISTRFVDTDYPLFRLADVYLMDAEALVNTTKDFKNTAALNDVDVVRQRAYGSNYSPVTDLVSTDFFVKERGYELYWECQRRTDLIRLGKFSGATYLWDWKGGVSGGISTPASAVIFPIPASEILLNNNLVQN